MVETITACSRCAFVLRGWSDVQGKMLNVRDVSRAAVIKNEEIHNLVQILGLKFV